MRRGGGPLTVLALAQAVSTYEFTVAFVALYPVVADLGVPAPLVPWVPGAYAVVLGGGLLAGGRVADRYGSRRVLRGALVAFAATTAMVALAGSPVALLAGRAGQGLAAALLQPAVLGAMAGVAAGPGRARARAWGVWSAVGAGGLALGAAAGGLLVEVHWRLAVGVVAPVCLVAAAGARALPSAAVVGQDRFPTRATVVTTTAGVASAATITVGGAVGATAPVTSAVALVAAVAVAGAVVGERSSAPMVGADLWRRPDVRLGAVLAAAYMAGPGALYFLVTTRLTDLTGDPPSLVGLALLPVTVGVVAGSGAAGRVVATVGEERGAAVGLGLAAAGTVGMALAPVDAWCSAAPSLVAGLGSGLAFAAVFALAGRDVPAARRGAVGGVVAAAQYLASAVALAAYGVLAGPLGPRGALVLAAGLTALGAVTAGVCARQRGR